MYIDVKKHEQDPSAPLLLTNPIKPEKPKQNVKVVLNRPTKSDRLSAQEISDLFQEVSEKVYGTGQTA